MYIFTKIFSLKANALAVQWIGLYSESLFEALMIAAMTEE